MARLIVRYSINGERSNETGNRLRKLLELPEGLGDARKIGTGSFEVEATSKMVMALLGAVLQKLSPPEGGGQLDHLWIYVDNPEPSGG